MLEVVYGIWSVVDGLYLSGKLPSVGAGGIGDWRVVVVGASGYVVVYLFAEVWVVFGASEEGLVVLWKVVCTLSPEGSLWIR